jgi:hypothetical protein
VEVTVKCKGQCVEQLVLCCTGWLVITALSVLQDWDHNHLKFYCSIKLLFIRVFYRAWCWLLIKAGTCRKINNKTVQNVIGTDCPCAPCYSPSQIASCLSVCPPVHPSACNKFSPTEWIFIKFGIWIFENLLRKFKCHLKLHKNTGTLLEDLSTFMITSRRTVLRRNISDIICRENQNTHFIFNNFFFPKIHRPYGAYALHAGYNHTLRICNTYCFSTATMVARTRLNITLYVHGLYCWNVRKEVRQGHISSSDITDSYNAATLWWQALLFSCFTSV